MLHPPSHRIDAEAILVLEEDSAWDHTRIAKEREAMVKAKQDPDRHPVAVYLSGETRFDLSAPIRLPNGDEARASDYLSLGEAWQFKLKRLGWSQVYAIEAAQGRDFANGSALSCRIGLGSVDGLNAPQIEHDKLGLVADESMQALFDLRPSLPVQIGVAVFQASMPLKPAEKKP